MKKLKITLIRSLIGYKQDQRATVRALGLGKIGTSVVQEDNPTIRGMVHKVRHLVKVEEVKLNKEVQQNGITCITSGSGFP